MEDPLIKKRIISHVLPLSVAAIFLSAPFLCAQTPSNTITLTTYYPAPFGAYKKMTISDSVGIGTTVPERVLHVRATKGNVMLLENDGLGNTVLELRSAQNAQRAINFLSAPDNNAVGQIAVYGDFTSGSYMTFHTTTTLFD